MTTKRITLRELRSTIKKMINESYTRINYEKLMALNPTQYGEMVNSIGQTITFYEHPIHGDESPVIAACHELGVAGVTGFYELDDMMEEHGEYEPSFQDGWLHIGEF